MPKGVQLDREPQRQPLCPEQNRCALPAGDGGFRTYQCTYLYANLLGNEAGRIIYDGEVLMAHNGQLMLRNQLLCFKEVDLECAEVCFSADPEDSRNR